MGSAQVQRNSQCLWKFWTANLLAQLRAFILLGRMDLHFCSMTGKTEKLKQMLVSSVQLQEIIHNGKLSSYTWKYFSLFQKCTLICGNNNVSKLLSHLSVPSLLLFLSLQHLYDFKLSEYVCYILMFHSKGCINIHSKYIHPVATVVWLFWCNSVMYFTFALTVGTPVWMSKILTEKHQNTCGLQHWTDFSKPLFLWGRMLVV